ncbi:enolase 2 [Artemisia annua]|uniref:phosphopyruvate hydratase n=1 Tax=Artemisia annua TaxID=35608 RepID=A0A2U1MI66_ARTAN|nr:enolase 2 [Artemisia annua]
MYVNIGEKNGELRLQFIGRKPSDTTDLTDLVQKDPSLFVKGSMGLDYSKKRPGGILNTSKIAPIFILINSRISRVTRQLVSSPPIHPTSVPSTCKVAPYGWRMYKSPSRSGSSTYKPFKPIVNKIQLFYNSFAVIKTTISKFSNAFGVFFEVILQGAISAPMEKRVRFPKKKTKPGDEVLTTSANVPQVAEDESEEAKVVIGMDVIASEFYGKKDKTYADYFMQNINGKEKISGEQLKDLYKSFMSEYPIVSIEDPFDQDDWEDYAKMTVECGEQLQRVKKLIDEKTCNALLL